MVVKKPGIPGVDIYCRDLRRKGVVMRKVTNFLLGTVIAVTILSAWIGAILYVEWAGNCVRLEWVKGGNINRCLNPANW